MSKTLCVLEIDKQLHHLYKTLKYETKTYATFLSETDQCTTPRQQLGDCKNIKECPALLQLLNRRPLTASNADYLRRSQCGFEGTDPKVCCPLTNNESAQTTSKPTGTGEDTIAKNPRKLIMFW